MSRNRALVTTFICMIIVLLIASSISAALPSIDFNQFYGEVKGADDGAKVTAKLGEKVVGETTIREGRYGYDTLLKIAGESSKGAKKGDIVEFYVNEQYVSSTDFKPGEATKLDLALVPAVYCGDNICNEDACSCRTDCGACPEDKDDDGVLDIEDKIIVRKEKIAEKMKNVDTEKVKIKIGGDEEIKEEYAGKKEISISEDNKPILKFDFDFDTKKLNLEEVAVEKQSSIEQKGYVVVKGLENEAGTKTIYLDKLNSDSKSVCIKDAPVDSIGQLSENCNGESEIYLKCDGAKKENYVCNELGSQFEVSGVKNSAAREVTAQEQASVEAAQETASQEATDCALFPDKFSACEPFSCRFIHPFTGELMEKNVIGLIENKCQYIEEMPNSFRMDCEYSESLRKAVAQYYRDIDAAESSETSVSIDFGSDEVKTKYTIDDKAVENPLQEALDNGACQIVQNVEQIPVTQSQTITPKVYACNDGIDNDNDGLSDLNDPGCTNSRDNDETNICAENWQCSKWSECNAGVRTRTCADVNRCSTEKDIPGKKIACSAEVKEVASFEEDTLIEQLAPRQETVQEVQQAPLEIEKEIQEPQIYEPELQENTQPVKSSAIVYISFTIMAVLGLMLGFMFFHKAGPLPAPPMIARKEKEILKKELKALEEDDVLFGISLVSKKKDAKKSGQASMKQVRADKKSAKNK